MPSDLFRPTPAPRPTPGRPGTSAISESPGSLILDFDPLTISLAPGQQKSILVRAGGDQSVSDVSLSIRFDPAVAAAVAVRPILIDGGMADARIESGHILVEIPSGMTVSGTRAIAEILLQPLPGDRGGPVVRWPVSAHGSRLTAHASVASPWSSSPSSPP